MGSVVVGDSTYHELNFKSPAPLYDGFLMIVSIPEECQAPMDQDFSCIISEPLGKSKCRINGQRVTIEIEIDEEYPGARI